RPPDSPAHPQRREPGAEAATALTSARPSGALGGRSRFLFDLVGERAHALDEDAHRAPGFHRAHADRAAAGDHVARLERHVLGNQAHQLLRRKDDVRKRIVLALLVVEDGFYDELAGIDLGFDPGTERPEGVEAL